MTKPRARLFMLAVCVIAAGAPVRAALPLLGFGITTDYKAPAGDLVHSSADGILLAPSLIDVDHNASTGVAGMDLLVHVGVGAGSVTVRTLRLLPVDAGVLQPPKPMPLRLEITLTDPRPASTYRVALGFDTLSSTTPMLTEATFGITGTGRGSAFTLDLSTRDAGEDMGVTAELFSDPGNGSRVDPKLGRIDFSPVPATAHVGVTTGAPVADSLRVDFTTATPTVATVRLQDIEGSSQARLDARIDKLPASLSFTLSSDGAGLQSADYTATDRVSALDVSFRQTNGAAIERDAVLHISDMALQVSFTQDSPTHSVFSSESPIGRLEVGVSEGGAVRLLSESSAYLYLDDRSGVDSLALKLFGLEQFEAETADPSLYDVTLAAGPLHVLLIKGAAIQQAFINNMPHRATVRFSAGDGTLSYQGSSVIDLLTFDMIDPAGISGRAKALHLLASGVPTNLDLSFGESGGTTSLDANGGSLGLIEVQLTSGPDERIDPAYDGVLLRDLPDRYVAFARITGLKKVVLKQGPPPDLQLNTTGGRILKVDLNRQVGSKVEYVRATLDHLIPSISIKFIEGAGQELFYDASASTNSISLDTNSGDRWNLHASLSGPLPASMHFCAASDGYCTGYARPAGAGSYYFDASEHTTVSIFDCSRPLSASCPGSPSQYTSVNLRLRHLEADADFSGTGFDGGLYMNTTTGARHTMNGSLTSITGGNGGFSASFGGGFWADHRRTTWTGWGLFKNKSGSVNCTGGTGMSVRVLGFWLGVSSFLC